MLTLAWMSFGIGGFFALVNIYTSFIRYPIHRLLGGTRETFRFVSGIPLFGSIGLSAAAMLFHHDFPTMMWIAVTIALLDPLGLVALIVTMIVAAICWPNRS